jgi:hypothetical protein
VRNEASRCVKAEKGADGAKGERKDGEKKRDGDAEIEAECAEWWEVVDGREQQPADVEVRQREIRGPAIIGVVVERRRKEVECDDDNEIHYKPL